MAMSDLKGNPKILQGFFLISGIQAPPPLPYGLKSVLKSKDIQAVDDMLGLGPMCMDVNLSLSLGFTHFLSLKILKI